MRAARNAVAGVALMFAAFMAWAYLSTDTYLGRWFAWRASDVADMRRFPARPIAAASNPRPLQRDLTEANRIDVAYILHREDRVSDLATLLAATRTSAFVALHDGSVAVEWYGDDHGPGSMVTSFSIAKSITALLALAAVEDGHVASLDEPITTYLPELAGNDPGYQHVTLRHLLDMRSGIRFRDHDLPWGDKARVYYEPNLRELVMTLPLSQPPGESFRYNSYNPVLVGLALERATGMEVATYVQERLWAPLGAQSPASWSVSREGETLPKMESGFNATALDMARFGLLLLGQGVATEGRGVIRDAILIRSTLAPLLSVGTAPDMPGLPSDVDYRLGWWHYLATSERPRSLAALGHLGQYLFVYPEHDVIVARFGESTGGVGSWRHVFDQVALALSRGR